jgi:3-oxoacyl-[acyl-carrier protein] reductase
MALALAPWQIRVNAIVPGNVQVDNSSSGGATGANAAQLTIPLGRPGRPADIGAAAAFLASDDARYVTGTRLVVDGGMDAQLRSPGVDNLPDLDYFNSLARRGFQSVE